MGLNLPLARRRDPDYEAQLANANWVFPDLPATMGKELRGSLPETGFFFKYRS
jgi:hypothetical protein